MSFSIDNETQTETVGPLFELRLPEFQSREQMIDQAEKIENFLIDIQNTDLLIVLARSGCLALEIVKGYEAALYSSKGAWGSNRLTEIPTVELLVGRELGGQCEEDTGVILPSPGYISQEVYEVKLPLKSETKAVKVVFSWLEAEARKSGSQTSENLRILREMAAGLGLVAKIVVLDEYGHSGFSQRVATPFFLGKVFPGAQMSVHQIDGDIARNMVKASFPRRIWDDHLLNDEGHARSVVLENLINGGVDYEGKLVPITQDNFFDVGQRVADFWRVKKNPAEELVAEYGLGNLLKIHEKALVALRLRGINLFYQRMSLSDRRTFSED